MRPKLLGIVIESISISTCWSVDPHLINHLVSEIHFYPLNRNSIAQMTIKKIMKIGMHQRIDKRPDRVLDGSGAIMAIEVHGARMGFT